MNNWLLNDPRNESCIVIDQGKFRSSACTLRREYTCQFCLFTTQDDTTTTTSSTSLEATTTTTTTTTDFITNEPTDSPTLPPTSGPTHFPTVPVFRCGANEDCSLGEFCYLFNESNVCLDCIECDNFDCQARCTTLSPSESPTGYVPGLGTLQPSAAILISIML